MMRTAAWMALLITVYMVMVIALEPALLWFPLIGAGSFALVEITAAMAEKEA